MKVPNDFDIQKLPRANKIALRVISLVIFVPFALWAFVSTLASEIRRAFYYAWLEVRMVGEDLAKVWRLTR